MMARPRTPVLLDLWIEFGFASHDRVQPLDGGDRHLGDRIDGVAGELLEVVQLGQLSTIVGRGEVLELLERLSAEVRPVNQEQDALGPGILDQPIGDIGSGVGLPEPVAIWISARGLKNCNDISRLRIARCWASHSHGVSAGSGGR